MKKNETLKEVLYNAITYQEKIEDMLETVFDEFNGLFEELELDFWKRCEFYVIDRLCTLQIDFMLSEEYEDYPLEEVRYVKFYLENNQVYIEVVDNINKTFDDQEPDYVTNVLQDFLIKKLSAHHVSEM